MRRNLLLAFACALAIAAAAQPTWRFHLAFEDGTGARDTIWMVYDTMATVGSDFQPQVDYALGEGAAQIDYSSFNVFTWNWDGDSTKIHALPYTHYPFHDGTIIDAINWTPPMTISWDTSLFHAPYLPYIQGHFGIAYMDAIAFSQFDTGLGFGMYNMLTSDDVTIDFLSELLFPFGVAFGAVDDVGLADQVMSDTILRIWPNPTASQICFRLPTSEVKDVLITDLTGRKIPCHGISTSSGTVDVSMLPPGLYQVHLISTQNLHYHGLFEKMP